MIEVVQDGYGLKVVRNGRGASVSPLEVNDLVLSFDELPSIGGIKELENELAASQEREREYEDKIDDLKVEIADLEKLRAIVKLNRPEPSLDTI